MTPSRRIASLGLKSALIALAALMLTFPLYAEGGVWPLWNTLVLAALIVLGVSGVVLLWAWARARIASKRQRDRSGSVKRQQ